jgi:cell wall-associated NlpC family hydrolase
LGQSPKSGFDCSGFVRFVLHEVGLVIPEYIGQDGMKRPIRHANEFWDNYGIAVHDENKQPGDLIFFSRRGSFPTHIGIVRDEKTYIHAPGTDESRVDTQPISYETIAKRGIERQLYTRNPIGFKSPTIKIERPTYRYHQTPI